MQLLQLLQLAIVAIGNGREEGILPRRTGDIPLIIETIEGVEAIEAVFSADH